MPRGVRWVFAIALGSVLLVSLAVGATVGSVYHSGMISVSVQPRDGGGINVAMPAGVANMALAAIELVPASSFALDESSDEVLEVVERYLPAAQKALDELAAQPDFVLVEVQSRDETVVVRKEGRSLRVVIDSDEARIDVTVPLSTVKEFTRHMRRISRDYDR